MSERFDDILRDKLARARHDGAPDWDALRAELDGASFDETLAAGLGAAPGISATAGALPDWGSLSAKLDADAAASGEAFDALISRRMARATAEESPATSWRQLSHRIDTMWPLRRRLKRYRVLEMAAALLLLATFLPTLRDHFATAGDGDAVLAHSENPGREAAPTHANHPGTPTDEDAAKASFSDGRMPASDAGGAYSPVDNLLGALGLRDVSADVRSAEEIATLFGVSTDRGDAGHTASPVPPSGGTPRISLSGFEAPGLSELALLDDPVRSARAYVALPAGALSVLRAPTPRLTVPALAPARKPWSFGASGTFKTWRVVTPADAAFEQASSGRLAKASQFGAHVLRDVGARWRLGVSLGTASATYETGLPEIRRRAGVTQAGYDVSEDFRGIDLDVAQATVDVRRALLPSDRAVQVWAKAGLGTSAFLRSAYEVHREDVASRSAPPTPNFAGVEQFAPKQTLERSFVPTQQKDFTEGLLQGGSLTDNTQFFGRLGVETELKLGERLRAFGAVDYDVALPGQDGFGPNRDRFGGYGVELGARISL